MRAEGPYLVSSDPRSNVRLGVRPAGPVQPLPFSCSFKTLLLLFKDEQDGRGVGHMSSFLPGLRGIFLVTC